MASSVLGYPNFIKDPKLLDERYKTLDVRNTTYFENNLNLNYYNLQKNLEKINEPVNKTTWSKYRMKLDLHCYQLRIYRHVTIYR